MQTTNSEEVMTLINDEEVMILRDICYRMRFNIVSESVDGDYYTISIESNNKAIAYTGKTEFKFKRYSYYQDISIMLDNRYRFDKDLIVMIESILCNSVYKNIHLKYMCINSILASIYKITKINNITRRFNLITRRRNLIESINNAFYKSERKELISITEYSCIEVLSNKRKAVEIIEDFCCRLSIRPFIEEDNEDKNIIAFSIISCKRTLYLKKFIVTISYDTYNNLILGLIEIYKTYINTSLVSVRSVLYYATYSVLSLINKLHINYKGKEYFKYRIREEFCNMIYKSNFL